MAPPLAPMAVRPTGVAISCPSTRCMRGLMPNAPLDGFDRRIIAALQADGRLTNVALAERIGLSPSPCLRRVKRLEQEGYIDAYRAQLSRSRIGLDVTVFV